MLLKGEQREGRRRLSGTWRLDARRQSWQGPRGRRRTNGHSVPPMPVGPAGPPTTAHTVMRRSSSGGLPPPGPGQCGSGVRVVVVGSKSSWKRRRPPCPRLLPAVRVSEKGAASGVAFPAESRPGRPTHAHAHARAPARFVSRDGDLAKCSCLVSARKQAALSGKLKTHALWRLSDGRWLDVETVVCAVGRTLEAPPWERQCVQKLHHRGGNVHILMLLSCSCWIPRS